MVHSFVAVVDGFLLAWVDSFSEAMHLMAVACLRSVDVDTLTSTRSDARHLTRYHDALPDQKKAGRIAIKLLSTAGTGFFYTASKNVRISTGKMALRKVRQRTQK